MPNGNAIVNFGPAPAGNSSASVVVTGQSAILSVSAVDAWIFPSLGTADHSEDEHICENFKVTVTSVVAFAGFTINVEVMGPPGSNDVWGNWQVAWAWR